VLRTKGALYVGQRKTIGTWYTVDTILRQKKVIRWYHELNSWRHLYRRHKMFLPSVCSTFLRIISANVTHQTRLFQGFGTKKCEGILKNKQHTVSLPPFTFITHWIQRLTDYKASLPVRDILSFMDPPHTNRKLLHSVFRHLLPSTLTISSELFQ
jgi:hypothetical protein